MRMETRLVSLLLYDEKYLRKNDKIEALESKKVRLILISATLVKFSDEFYTKFKYKFYRKILHYVFQMLSSKLSLLSVSKTSLHTFMIISCNV